MNFSDFSLVSIWWIIFIFASYGYGELLVTKILRIKTNAALKLLTGIGVVANLGLLAALFAQFRFEVISVTWGFGLFLAVSNIIKNWKSVVNKLQFYKFLTFIKSDYVASFAIVISLFVGISLFLSSFQPPISSDELHYHFPQARSIAEKGNINWVLSGNPDFFENIPKIIEVLFAQGLLLSGYSLAHLLNYSIMIAFVWLVFIWMLKYYGYRAAGFAVLLLLLFEDFTWNGTVGFIDTATTAFEIAALMYYLKYLFDEIKYKRENLLISGVLIGLALGAKYSPLPTAFVMVLGIVIARFKNVKELIYDLIYLVVPAILTGGFWYVKNLLIFRNPFYPLYFGHQGMSSESYVDLMNAIQQWEPKTLSSFMNKIGRYWTYSGSTTYVSIFAAPLAIVFKRNRQITLFLTGYFVLYVTYWFFLGTHQVRFLLTGLVVATLLTGIMLAKIPNKIAVIAAGLLLIVSLIYRPYPERNLLEHYVWIKLHVVERQFALGNITETEFLSREFGCAYKTIDFLNNVGNKRNVIDNWTLWQGPSTQYFTKGYQYRLFELGEKVEPNKVWEEVERRNIGYLYLRKDYKELSHKDNNIFMQEHVGRAQLAEEIILAKAKLIFSSDECQLYEIAREN